MIIIPSIAHKKLVMIRLNAYFAWEITVKMSVLIMFALNAIQQDIELKIVKRKVFLILFVADNANKKDILLNNVVFLILILYKNHLIILHFKTPYAFLVKVLAI